MQDVGSSASPVGNAGSDTHDVTVPLSEGFAGVMAMPCVITKGLPGYEKPEGGAA